MKNTDSVFVRDGFNAQGLLKEVRLKARRHASKDLAKFGDFNGAQHANGFGLSKLKRGRDVSQKSRGVELPTEKFEVAPNCIQSELLSTSG